MYDNLITMNDIDVKRSEKMKEKVRYVFYTQTIRRQFRGADLTNFMPLAHSIPPENIGEVFLMFSRGIEKDQWHEMG